MFELHNEDCLNAMRVMADNSVDSIVTDPPYELGFMGKKWDASGIANSVEMWAEALRVLKPGGHLLAFSGSRTYHRMTCAIEDAGFEVRDQIMWVYGSGFPKSLDVSKAIDKAAGHARATEYTPNFGNATFGKGLGGGKHNAASEPPVTAAAAAWEGWGTALKPAHEPICVARKPLTKGHTVAANVLHWGTGAMNIDACRVEGADAKAGRSRHGGGRMDGNSFQMPDSVSSMPEGRWPANLIHDGSDEVLAGFPVTAKGSAKPRTRDGTGSDLGLYGGGKGHKNKPSESQQYADGGSAARFFYCPKASKKDREEGLEAFAAIARPNGNKWTDQDYRVTSGERPASAESGPLKNTHQTVKPAALMAYLVRLVTPPGGVVLDPFMGSGSTGKAALAEGFRFIGIDMTPEYVEIARARILAAANDNQAANAAAVA